MGFRGQRWPQSERAGASSNHSCLSLPASSPPKIRIRLLWSIAAECSSLVEGRLLGAGSSFQVRACKHETLQQLDASGDRAGQSLQCSMSSAVHDALWEEGT